MAYAFNDGLSNGDMWLRTGRAAHALGISEDTLKRYAFRDEFLIEGVHWRRGPHPNSPITWNISACEKALQWQGRFRSGIGRPRAVTSDSVRDDGP